MKKGTLAIILISLWCSATAQIPVEIFGGHQKASLDIMFFKYFKKEDGENSRFLFFNRNRALIDYRQTSGAYLPQFGFTEAVSYNHSRLKGIAPVVSTQILNRGVYLKPGIQYVFLSKNFLLFTWVVVDINRNPGIDYYFLSRYTPKLTDNTNLFFQIELVNTLPTGENINYSFTERGRAGLKCKNWQFGFGADFNEVGRDDFTCTNNLGSFVRYEF